MKHLKSNSDFSLSMDEMLAYVNGQLSESEKSRIEMIITKNPLYEEAINELRIAAKEEGDIDYILGNYSLEMENEIYQIADNLPKEEIKESKPGISIRKKWFDFPQINLGRLTIDRRVQMQFALSVLFLSLIVYTVYLWQRPPLDIRLANQYLSHYEDPNKVLDNIKEIAIKHYYDKNYEAAIPLFEQLLSQSQNLNNLNQIRVFLAVSLLHTEKHQDAELYLKAVISHGDNIYLPAAKWYLSLAYLSRQERDQAIPILRELSTMNSGDRESKKFATQARELLDQLE